jgi:hypothetical protein
MGTPSLVLDVRPFRFLVSLTPTLVDRYWFAVISSHLWGIPEVLEILGFVLDRFGLCGRTG